jgi:ABC-type oligopeptide transport system ATPase subunit
MMIMPPETDAPPLLRVERLCVDFPARGGLLGGAGSAMRAVDDVSFQIRAGRTLGLVGESGCGKTTVGRAVLRLVRAASGRVLFSGATDGIRSSSAPVSILDLPRSGLRRARRGMQMIFQDPAGSLNPRMTVGQIVGEPLLVHGIARGVPLRQRVERLLDRCGLPRSAMPRYPHEFSGGQRQRIGIARALSLEPRLVVCDEPTSALDVSIQAQILNLLKDLQREFGLAYLFISHDMAVVSHMCDSIAVMSQGSIVETGTRDAVIDRPQHAHTRALLDAVPAMDPHRTRRMAAAAGHDHE